MMFMKIILLMVITTSLMMSLWKTSIGLVFPLLMVWGYGWVTKFADFSIVFIIVFSVIHVVFQLIVWRISNTRRDANLAFTGMGVVGFALGMLSSLFFGAFLGFFLWLGSIGRLITQPLSLGVKNIALNFLAGGLKVIYGIIMSGVISYLLF